MATQRERTLVFSLLLLSLLSSPSYAQLSSGSNLGTITDASGAAVLGVFIKIVNPATSLTREVATNEDGNFRVDQLPIRVYNVEIKKTGFKEEGVHITPDKRELGMVFPSYAIWPHLTVGENVAFPLRVRGQDKAEIRKRGAQPLDLVREELKVLQARLRFAALFVTHDQSEALNSSNKIAVMNHGVRQQCGTPRTVVETPVNEFVRDFFRERTIYETSTISA